MFLEKWINDIKEKTVDMDRKETCAYIAAYYWPHILGCISVIALILFWGGHCLFGNVKPEFTCVIVNQNFNNSRDQKLVESFAREAGRAQKKVVINSDYNFSYKNVHLDGVNESSYEKFFFQWRNCELDAVIIPESFYYFCKEMGGEFQTIEGAETGDLEGYVDDGEYKAVILGSDGFAEKINGDETELLLLAFPETGKHEVYSRVFLQYVCDVYEGRVEDIDYEEIIN